MNNPFPQGTPLHELASIINQTAQRWVKAEQEEKKEPAKEKAA